MKGQKGAPALLKPLGDAVTKRFAEDKYKWAPLADLSGMSKIHLRNLSMGNLENLGLSKIIDVANALDLKVDLVLSAK